MCDKGLSTVQNDTIKCITSVGVVLRSLATINAYKCLYKCGLGDINVCMLDTEATEAHFFRQDLSSTPTPFLWKQTQILCVENDSCGKK